MDGPEPAEAMSEESDVGFLLLGIDRDGNYQAAKIHDKHFLLRLCDEDRARIDALTAALLATKEVRPVWKVTGLTGNDD